MRYRKKPVVIEAFQFRSDGPSPVPDWFCSALAHGDACWRDNKLFISTLEGEMQAQPDDWIIKGIKGEIYPCKPDIFAATYEAVSE